MHRTRPERHRDPGQRAAGREYRSGLEFFGIMWMPAQALTQGLIGLLFLISPPWVARGLAHGEAAVAYTLLSQEALTELRMPSRGIAPPVLVRQARPARRHRSAPPGECGADAAAALSRCGVRPC
ncbi:hypothetical protein CGZ93_17225 [Enemella dayhoffiae]|uniref:Uncharacterized protein n=1 Tax=Enemella dayhoffiae TaxID=2016507 RepID=A0A255GNZ8_9ACTN|nr:hypothetical protein [Enemella dayhoffiae]OYO17301.1 hypothetical protein CGZ93_17225 [Enemella dayhoffiae]